MADLLPVLFCFSIIFGPKVGFLDLSVFVPALLLPLLTKGNWRLPRPFVKLTGTILALACYQAVLQVVNAEMAFETTARLLRACVSTLLVGWAIGARDPGTQGALQGAIFRAVFVHAALLIVAAVVPEVNIMVAGISGNIQVKYFRASGLLAGFDIAGLVNVLGIAMLVYWRGLVKSDAIRGIAASIFLVSAFYCSRVTMALAIGMFLVFLRAFLSRARPSLFRSLYALGALAGLAFAVYSMIEILNVTLAAGLFDVDPEVAADILSRHAAQDPDEFLWEAHVFFPSTIAGVVFGLGREVLNSDIGYVKDMFRFGLVGLCVALWSHVAFMRRFRPLVGPTAEPAWALVRFAFVAILVLNFKNNYTFVRAIFPLFLLLVSATASGGGPRSLMGSPTQ